MGAEGRDVLRHEVRPAPCLAFSSHGLAHLWMDIDCNENVAHLHTEGHLAAPGGNCVLLCAFSLGL